MECTKANEQGLLYVGKEILAGPRRLDLPLFHQNKGEKAITIIIFNLL